MKPRQVRIGTEMRECYSLFSCQAAAHAVIAITPGCERGTALGAPHYGAQPQMAAPHLLSLFQPPGRALRPVTHGVQSPGNHDNRQNNRLPGFHAPLAGPQVRANNGHPLRGCRGNLTRQVLKRTLNPAWLRTAMAASIVGEDPVSAHLQLGISIMDNRSVQESACIPDTALY